MQVDTTFLVLAGALASGVLEYVIEPLWVSYATLEGPIKRIVVGVVTAIVGLSVLVLNCQGLLPTVGFECPAANAWLEYVGAAVWSIVGSQVAHRLIKKMN